LASPISIQVKKTPGDNFPRILSYDLGPIPKSASFCPECTMSNERGIYHGYVICDPGCGFKYRQVEPEEVDFYGDLCSPDLRTPHDRQPKAETYEDAF
jgi:hypothetical protein